MPAAHIPTRSHAAPTGRRHLLATLCGAIAIASLCTAAFAQSQSQPQPQSRSPAPSASQATAFNGAMALLRQSDFAGARDAFARYVDTYPSGPLTADAYYRKGFAHYALREYLAALAAFAKAHELAPTRYAAQAMLSMAAVHQEVRNYAEAKRLNELVVDHHPDSEAATEARKRLGLAPGAPTNNSHESRGVENDPPDPGTAAAARPRPGAPANDSYAARISAAISQNIVYTELGTAPEAEVTIHVTTYGLITRRAVTRPSTSPEWNHAVIRAIDKTQRLPPDKDGTIPEIMVLVLRAR